MITEDDEKKCMVAPCHEERVAGTGGLCVAHRELFDRAFEKEPQERNDELEALRARVAQPEALATPARCDHPTYLVRRADGLNWCSVCGAIAGSNGEPHFRDVPNGSFHDGPPHPLAWVRPERAP